jgi:hypothetical protein
MFKHYFEQMEQVSIYPIFSLIVFGLFFLGLLAWVWKVSSKYINHMSNLPIDTINPID